MIDNPDVSLVGADPIYFSEFVDRNGLVCFQIQTDFCFRERLGIAILRVSREVWLGIHDESVSLADQPLTPDEQIVEQVKILIDQRQRRTPKLEPKSVTTTVAEHGQMVTDVLERQVWDLRLEKVIFGDVVQSRDREIKIGSLFVKDETEWIKTQIMRRPKGLWNGRFFTPITGF